MEHLFKNDLHNKHFDEQGFVRLQFLNQAEVASLLHLFKQNCNYPEGIVDSGMYFSLLSLSTGQTEVVKKAVREIFLPAYERVFENYRSLAESFLAKAPDKEADLMLHQDWSYVKEQEWASATLWCPLTDVKVFNGAMYCIPKSHRFFSNIRSATYPTSRIKNSNELTGYLVPLELNAGEAVIFHQALWHGSYPNLSNALRVVATSIVVEKDAPFVYFQKAEQENTADVFELNDDAFLKELNTLSAGANPKHSKKKGQIAYEHLPITLGDLLAKADETKTERRLA
jgi:hypothetical protein